MVLLGYSRAFNFIIHDFLAAKMTYFGFGERSVERVGSYLYERVQITKLGMINLLLSYGEDWLADCKVCVPCPHFF